MIDTKLILVEGLPGSGKTTTARNIANAVIDSGKACQWWFEWDQDHPIPLGNGSHLDQVIAASISREAEMLKQWQQFARQRESEDLVTVMESRFWQTSAMIMYIAGHPIESVLESNQRIIDAIQGLKPVLIYFAFDDPKAFAERTIRIKNEEWKQPGLEASWSQTIYAALDSQKWFTEHGMAGKEGLAAFFEEWALISEGLYSRAPFPKIKIRNPYQDWTLSMQQMRAFLDLA